MTLPLGDSYNDTHCRVVLFAIRLVVVGSVSLRRHVVLVQLSLASLSAVFV